MTNTNRWDQPWRRIFFISGLLHGWHFSRKCIKNQTQTYWVNVEQQGYNLYEPSLSTFPFIHQNIKIEIRECTISNNIVICFYIDIFFYNVLKENPQTLVRLYTFYTLQISYHWLLNSLENLGKTFHKKAGDV